jgi:hypothetical protein
MLIILLEYRWKINWMIKIKLILGFLYEWVIMDQIVIIMIII